MPADGAKPAQSAPAPQPAAQPAAKKDTSNVPALAPFTGPADGRPLPSPVQLAGMDLSGPAPDQDIDTALQQYQSEALVQTAGKRAQKLNDVPLTVSWIPADELEGTGQFTLCDAIQYFPGMECRRGPMRKVAISARGLGSNFLSNRLLLLQDGRPQTDPWTGQFYGDETTPLTNVKQIEVIRGPGSSLYGSNAFSGVINVIRRRPQDLIKEGHDVGTDVRFLAGQNSTYRVQATGAGKSGDLAALVNYYGMSTAGPELFNDSRLNIVDHNEWATTHQLAGRAEYKSVSVDADYTMADLGRPGGMAINAVGNCGRCHYTPNDAEHVQTLNANAQVDQKITDWMHVFGQGYILFKRRTVDLQNMITQEMQPTLGKRNRYGGELRSLFSFGKVNFTVGGDAKKDTVNNHNLLPEFTEADTKETILGAFADGEIRPTEKLILSAGGRLDAYLIPQNVWHNKSTQLSPRASIVYHAVPELTLRLNYGRAFRAPTLAELAVSQQMYAATLHGNPYLLAETLDTYEAAVDVWAAGGILRLTGTAFYNNAKNFINQEFQFGSTSEFENIGDARAVGMELEAAAQVKPLNSAFDVAYQYMDAQTVQNGKTLGQLDYAPNNRVYVRGRTNIGNNAFAELYGIFVGDRYDPAFNVDTATGLKTTRIKLPHYLVANARIGANVYKGLNVSLLAANLFNTEFSEVNGFPAAPFTVYTELKYTY